MENAHRKWERENGSEPFVTKRWLAETAEGRCSEGGGLGKVPGNGRKRRSQMGNGKGLRDMLGSIDVEAEEIEDDDDFIDRDKDSHWGSTSWQQVEGDGEEDEGEEVISQTQGGRAEDDDDDDGMSIPSTIHGLRPRGRNRQ